jgi:hypothetical protein
MKPAPNARARIHPAHCRCRGCQRAPRRTASLVPMLGVALALAGVSALLATIG